MSDHWQAFYISNGSGLDPAMCQRIQVEHDSFFLRAVTCILSSRNMGMWQYLAVLPYRSVAIDMLWKTYAHLNFISEEYIVDSLQSQGELLKIDVKFYKKPMVLFSPSSLGFIHRFKPNCHHFRNLRDKIKIPGIIRKTFIKW